MNSESIRARDLLRKELEARKQTNPSYSLRRFAKFLEIPVSTLSAILNDETNPTKTSLLNFAKKLGWSGEVLQNQINAAIEDRARKQKIYNERTVVKTEAEMLSSLVPFSVLTLARTNTFPASIEKLSATIGCSAEKIEEALGYLVSREFVRIEEGLLKARTVTIIDNPDSRRLVKDFVSGWLKFGSKQFRADETSGTNSFIFQIVVPRDQLSVLGAKFEEFGRGIRRKFPIDGATGELFSVGAVIFPSTPQTDW